MTTIIVLWYCCFVGISLTFALKLKEKFDVLEHP